MNIRKCIKSKGFPAYFEIVGVLFLISSFFDIPLEVPYSSTTYQRIPPG